MAEPRVITFTVPVPPSANRLWRNVPGLNYPVKAKEYTSWQRTAGWHVKRQLVGVATIECRFDVMIGVPVRFRDNDNNVKPILDLCEHAGIVTNDRNQHELSVYELQEDLGYCLVMLSERPDVPMKTRNKTTRGFKNHKQYKPKLSRIAKTEALRRKVMF